MDDPSFVIDDDPTASIEVFTETNVGDRAPAFGIAIRTTATYNLADLNELGARRLRDALNGWLGDDPEPIPSKTYECSSCHQHVVTYGDLRVPTSCERCGNGFYVEVAE